MKFTLFPIIIDDISTDGGSRWYLYKDVNSDSNCTESSLQGGRWTCGTAEADLWYFLPSGMDHEFGFHHRSSGLDFHVASFYVYDGILEIFDS